MLFLKVFLVVYVLIGVKRKVRVYIQKTCFISVLFGKIC